MSLPGPQPRNPQIQTQEFPIGFFKCFFIFENKSTGPVRNQIVEMPGEKAQGVIHWFY